LLMTHYFAISQLDDAISEAEQLLEIDPDNVGAINSIASVYLIKKDFDKAREYIELYGDKSKGNSYRLITYYDNLANLDLWNGKFVNAIDNFFLALDQAKLINDSMRICNRYNVISENYKSLGKMDSALFYSKKGYDWATQFQTLNYPLILVEIDPTREPEARPIFEKAMTNFRSKLPQEMWNLAEMIENQFEATIESDTLKKIELAKQGIETSNQDNTAAIFGLGRYQVLFGQYEDGRETLERLIDGKNATTRGYYYIKSLYYIGIANEALGYKKEAKSNFNEVLNYWGSPEIEIKEIKDTRARLSELTN